jgi:hypothetical protein
MPTVLCFMSEDPHQLACEAIKRSTTTETDEVDFRRPGGLFLHVLQAPGHLAPLFFEINIRQFLYVPVTASVTSTPSARRTKLGGGDPTRHTAAAEFHGKFRDWRA